MIVQSVNVQGQDAERARGTIELDIGTKMPWTAVRNEQGGWYIVLEGHLDDGDASILRLVLSTIRQALDTRLRAA